MNDTIESLWIAMQAASRREEVAREAYDLLEFSDKPDSDALAAASIALGMAVSEEDAAIAAYQVAAAEEDAMEAAYKAAGA